MKKITILGLSAALLLAACGNEQSTDTTETTSGSDTMESGKESIKSQLMQFYLSVSKEINSEDAPLNDFEIAQAEEALPSGTELSEMKEAAATAAEQAKQAVETIEVPESLSDYQEEIDGALASIATSYEMKIEELGKETVDFQAAAEKFAEADEALNELLEENGLVASNLYNEVSQ
ncbi:hypothetical protein BBI11_06610 [Planococcus maritimus]|uniref:hypothetical protein n=1 Tax=Planococcus maritimus TaxID=192421 RepID=UPI00080F2339|nr:hypothetical protein [Planococcus maritimus]ANU16728.1 hypothetical protein BBI11_06610 [Planococcus maritimus]